MLDSTQYINTILIPNILNKYYKIYKSKDLYIDITESNDMEFIEFPDSISSNLSRSKSDDNLISSTESIKSYISNKSAEYEMIDSDNVEDINKPDSWLSYLTISSYFNKN